MYNLIQVQNRLKELPSSPQTMQYLTAASKGQYPEIPPYVALGEMQRREALDKQMATAQGAAQGPTPTVADQMESKVKEQAAGLIALQQGRTQAAQQQQPPQGGPAPENIPQPEQQEEPPTMMAQGGIARLPVDSRMFNYQQGGVIGYAGGGAALARSTSGGKEWFLDIPATIRDPSVPFYRQIPNPAAAALADKKFASREEAGRAYDALVSAAAPAPAPTQEAAPKPMAPADMAMRRAPAVERGLPAALPKPKPSPVAQRPAPALAPQTPQVPPAPAQSEAQKFLMEQLRAKPATPMTDEQIIARNAGLRPEALNTPAGSEEMKRLDAMQKQYEASLADRGLEGLMAGLAGRTQGRGGMGAGYLRSQAANRAADMTQAELQNKMRANIEAARRGEATNEYKERIGTRTADEARRETTAKERTGIASGLFKEEQDTLGKQIMAKAQTDAARIMAAAREAAGGDSSAMKAVAAAERAYENDPEVKLIVSKLNSPLYQTTSDPKRLAEVQALVDKLKEARKFAYAAQGVKLPNIIPSSAAGASSPARPAAVDAALKKYQ